MLLMQLKGVNNEQILCTVQYTVLFSKYIVLETLACLITFIYTGCVETISGPRNNEHQHQNFLGICVLLSMDFINRLMPSNLMRCR